MAQYSYLVHTYEFYVEEHALIFHIAPACWYASIEFSVSDFLTVCTVYGDYFLPDRSDDTICWCRETALCHLVWDISLFSDDDGIDIFI